MLRAMCSVVGRLLAAVAAMFSTVFSVRDRPEIARRAQILTPIQAD
jgi:hypothetical protein